MWIHKLVSEYLENLGKLQKVNFGRFVYVVKPSNLIDREMQITLGRMLELKSLFNIYYTSWC